MFRRSFDLAKSSWSVIKVNKELLALPVISFSVILLFSLLFGSSFFFLDEEYYATLGIIGGLVGAYLFAVTVIFFQTAMVCAALQHFEGKDPTIGTAVRGAWENIIAIMGWALIAVIVQAVLAKLRDAGIIGRIVSALLGALFAFATFLVVPVIAAEGIGPINAMKRSAEMLKQTWGENIIGRIGLALFGFLLTLPAIVIGAIGVGLLASEWVVTGWLILFIAIMAFALAMVVMSALNSIYQAAVYNYGVSGQASGFSADQLRSSFRLGDGSNRRGGFFGSTPGISG